MKSEQAIQSEIIIYLRKIFCYPRKVVSKAGTPDILACCDGKFIGIEVKKLDGKVSKLQDHNIKLIQQAGGIAFVARSVKDVKDYFEKNKL